jgi:hypothetical protein
VNIREAFQYIESNESVLDSENHILTIMVIDEENRFKADFVFIYVGKDIDDPEPWYTASIDGGRLFESSGLDDGYGEISTEKLILEIKKDFQSIENAVFFKTSNFEIGYESQYSLENIFPELPSSDDYFHKKGEYEKICKERIASLHQGMTPASD